MKIEKKISKYTNLNSNKIVLSAETDEEEMDLSNLMNMLQNRLRVQTGEYPLFRYYGALTAFGLRTFSFEVLTQIEEKCEKCGRIL